jgi:hypothetical protein
MARSEGRLTPTGPRRFVVAARLRALSIACFLMYALAQLGSAVAGWMEFVDEERQHGGAAPLLGDDGYGWRLLEQTLQNWQSEFLALGVVVALTAVLLHRGSKLSRDGNDEARARMQSIRRRVDALVAERTG